jgi:dCMP deaminase
MSSNHHYETAANMAQWSKDLSTKVGAVLTNVHGQVIGVSCNELPPRVRDLPERRERPAKYLFTGHAEEKLICMAAQGGTPTLGGTIYTTHYPCASCARMIIQAGITRVVVGPGQTSMPPEQFDAARAMFREAGVAVKERDK